MVEGHEGRDLGVSVISVYTTLVEVTALHVRQRFIPYLVEASRFDAVLGKLNIEIFT